MQKAFIILSLIVILGCVSADYAIKGGWTVQPKKTFDGKTDAFYTNPKNIQISAQSANKNVTIYAYGIDSTTVTDNNKVTTTTTNFLVRNVSVPSFNASEEKRGTFPAGNDYVVLFKDANGNPLAASVVNGTANGANKNDIINIWTMNLAGGANTLFGSITTSGTGGSTRFASLVYQNKAVVIVYFDSGLTTTLLTSVIIDAKTSTTAASLVSNFDTAGSIACIPHSDGKNAYCVLNTKDTKDPKSPQLLQNITISASNPSTLGTIGTNSVSGISNFIPFSFNQTGVVYTTNKLIFYAEDGGNNTFNFTPADATATAEQVFQHNGNIAIFYGWASSGKINVAYQMVKGKQLVGGANQIVQEASGITASKSSDGSLFALVNDGTNANMGQVWAKAAASLQTAFVAIIAAFAAVLLF